MADKPPLYIPERTSRAEIETRLASNDPKIVYDAFIDAAYFEDYAWVQERCIAALSSPENLVRSAALYAIKILACVRGELDPEMVIPAVAALKDDPESDVVELAQDTLNDIRHAFAH